MEKELTSDKRNGCSLLCDPVSNTLKAKGESHMCIGQEVCSSSYENDGKVSQVRVFRISYFTGGVDSAGEF